jgi:hypothetical protein
VQLFCGTQIGQQRPSVGGRIDAQLDALKSGQASLQTGGRLQAQVGQPLDPSWWPYVHTGHSTEVAALAGTGPPLTEPPPELASPPQAMMAVPLLAVPGSVLLGVVEGAGASVQVVTTAPFAS